MCFAGFLTFFFSFQDAWLDGIETNPLYMGRSAANDTEKDEDGGDEKPVEELSQEDIGVRKRRIANVLEPGETVRDSFWVFINKYFFQNMKRGLC